MTAEGSTPSIYPVTDCVGERLGLEGAGILAYQTGDQLHPPLVDDNALWSDVRHWPEAAREHTRQAARLVGIQPGERVLDIGCGICGPARILVDDFGATVFAVTTDPVMLRTARRLNAARPQWASGIELAEHDCQAPYPTSGFDVAWSLNMLYQVRDHQALLANAHAALKPGGRLLIEDWMLLPAATAEDVNELEHHFGTPHYARVREFEGALLAAGFTILGIEDLGAVCRTLLATHAVPEFVRSVKPRLIEDFGDRGRQMSDEWVDGLRASVRMYREMRLTYLRVLAEKL